MDYSKLSDTDLNREVAKAMKLPWTFNGTNMIFVADDSAVGRHTFDPCNNPADAWPIIVGHKLSLINADDEWLCVPDDTAVDGTTGDEVQMIYSGAGIVHSNPLRAAMVMFLTIQDESNADV